MAPRAWSDEGEGWMESEGERERAGKELHGTGETLSHNWAERQNPSN